MILTLTASSVVLIGRAQPIPVRLAALHLGDMCELPCWIGITPGKTSMAQAKQIIVQVYGQAQVSHDNPTTQVVTLPDSASFAFELNTTSPDDPVLQRITIYLSSGAIPLGDVMNRVGPIRLISPFSGLLVRAQGIDLSVIWPAMSLDFDLELTSYVYALSIPSDPTWADQAYYAHWQGLGNYHVYRGNDSILILHAP